MDVFEVPLFYGEDPEEWVFWIDSYCSDHSFSDFEKLQFAYGFVEDDALTWFNGETSQSPFTSWVEFKLRLFQRFGKDNESIEAALKQKRALDFERRISFLDRLEKLLLPTKELLEKQNLGGEEKENTSLGSEEDLFGFVNTKRKEEHQQEEEIQTEAEMENCAYQVFDKMILRGKKVTQKRNKKKKFTKVKRSVTQKRKKMKKFTKVKRSKYKHGKVNTMSRQIQKEHKSRMQFNKRLLKRCKLVNYHVLYKSQGFKRRFMWRVTKRKKKRTRLGKHERKCVKLNKCGDHNRSMRETKMECERKGIKHELVFAKLLVGYRTVLKKLAKWKKHKFKQKHNKQREKIKAGLLSNQIVNLWNPKLEPGFFRKTFSEWCKKKHGCERTYLRFDKLLQLNGLVKQIIKLLGSKTRKRTKSKYKCVVYGKLLSLVTREWTKFLMGWKRTIFKNFCSFLMHTSENQIREIASRLIDVKNNDFGGLRGESICRNVEINLKNYNVVADFFPLELGGAEVTMKTPGLETLRNMEVNWKRQELKFQVNGVPISIHGNPGLCNPSVSIITIWKALQQGEGIMVSYKSLLEESMDTQTPPSTELVSELFAPAVPTAIQLEEIGSGVNMGYKLQIIINDLQEDTNAHPNFSIEQERQGCVLKTQKRVGELYYRTGMMIGLRCCAAAGQVPQLHIYSAFALGGLLQPLPIPADILETYIRISHLDRRKSSSKGNDMRVMSAQGNARISSRVNFLFSGS